MQISAIRANAFKARVESPSPLVSGDWQFITEDSGKNSQAEPKKESKWLRNSLIGAAAVAVVAIALALLGKTDKISGILNTEGGFKSVNGLGNKVLYGIGKAGQWVSTQWGKVVNLFSTKAVEAAEEAGGAG